MSTLDPTIIMSVQAPNKEDANKGESPTKPPGTTPPAPAQKPGELNSKDVELEQLSEHLKLVWDPEASSLVVLNKSGANKKLPQCLLYKARDGKLDSEGVLAWSFDSCKEQVFQVQPDKSFQAKTLKEIIVHEKATSIMKHSPQFKVGIGGKRAAVAFYWSAFKD